MKILFTSPVFASPEKESEFMDEVYAIAAYKGIESMRTHYLLKLDNGLVTVETIQLLFGLFDVWNIDKSPLESFVQYVEASSKESKSTSH